MTFRESLPSHLKTKQNKTQKQLKGTVYKNTFYSLHTNENSFFILRVSAESFRTPLNLSALIVLKV